MAIIENHMGDSNIDGCSPWDLTVEAFQTSGHSFRYVGAVFVAMVLGTFTASTLTKNYSQVDKLWSIVPFVYAWIVVCDDRTLLMAIVATIWGVRLTYNFSRRDGYKWPPWNGDEDYRWLLLQKGELIPALTNPIVWVTFNFLFVSLYQSILILLFTTPSLVAHVLANKPERCSSLSKPASAAELNALDYLAAIIIVVLVIVETVADNYQWAFQNEKYKRRGEAETAKANKKDYKLLVGDYADGFCQSGLFAIVRKPNYAAEQSIWVVYYLFSVAATKGESSWSSLEWYNWSISGWVLLLGLFQGSGYITEQITLKKYPKYADYMERVPQYVPNLFSSTKKDIGSKTKTS